MNGGLALGGRDDPVDHLTNDVGRDCDADADIRIYNPMGTIDTQAKHITLWKKKAPAPGKVVTGLVMGISVPTSDPIGNYRMEATVRDRVSSQVVELSAFFNITQ